MFVVSKFIKKKLKKHLKILTTFLNLRNPNCVKFSTFGHFRFVKCIKNLRYKMLF